MNEGAGTVTAGDAVAVLRTLPTASVDLVVTDPPYESLEKHRAIGTTTRLKESKASSNPWFAIFPNARFAELMTELFRVCRRGSHVYFFCDDETSWLLKPAAECAGFRYWKSLIWVKTKRTSGAYGGDASPTSVAAAAVSIGMGYHWRNSTERILFFEKGKRQLSNRSWPDVLFAPRVLGGYPTEKPAMLVERLILNSSTVGEVVLDPFCGSGVVGTVARRLGRHYLLADVDVAEATRRLAVPEVTDADTSTA
ncbi:MAG: site-specific DNA-methyltransferase [Myxococcales bacterium]|nr:site-specific DNA-methyltransferase [Myxococcales bacterium]